MRPPTLPDADIPPTASGHDHVFLGGGHACAERRTWSVIVLCGVMMVLEIVGGSLFGSIALVADGLHMSTHAGAMLLAALAYRYARRHAEDARFTFGTGKLGDLAGFTSAVVLAMIAILIGCDSVSRFVSPVPIRFIEVIPIACLGLAVNVASAWLLAGGEHHHHHGHDDGRDGAGDDGDHRVRTAGGTFVLSVFEDDHPAVFRLAAENAILPEAAGVSLETIRADGARQVFAFTDRGDHLQSDGEIPEPHAFEAIVRIGDQAHVVTFEEHAHAHGAAHRDNNLRAAVVHVLADAAVSVCVIVGLVLARAFGWLWMDPLAGLLGALVIASWSYGLIHDSGAILLDMNPDPAAVNTIRTTIESDGDRITDLHVWRLGPGHLGVILGVATGKARDGRFYRERLGRVRSLSHVTVEVERVA